MSEREWNEDEECPACGEMTFEAFEWGNLLKVLTCPSCGAKVEWQYDESWDPETGDESRWTWLTIAESDS
jgi:rRNA maturation protein Nop10